MAGVEKTLKIKDEFSSTLDRYIDKLNQSIAKEEALAEVQTIAKDAVEKWTASAKEWSAVADEMISDEGIWVGIVQDMSTKFLKPVDDLKVLSEAFRELDAQGASMQDLEIAMARFNRELAKNGGHWTEAADELNKFDVLATHSLEKLVKEGIIVTDGSSEILDKLDRVVSAAEEIDRLEQEADKRTKEGLRARIDELTRANAQLGKVLDYMTAAPKKAGKFISSLLGLDKAAQRFKGIKSGAQAARSPLNGLTNTVLRMGLSFFSIAKLVQYFKAGISRAPAEIMAPFTKLKNNLSDFFAGATVAAMDRMTAGVERLNAALSSPAGQKFSRAMEAVGRIIGDVVSVAFERLAQFVEWGGNNIEPIAIAAGIAFAIWAVHMTALAIATAAANLPLIMMIGLIAAVAAGLYASGTTADEVFGYIGAGLATLYGVGYNLIADGYNTVAAFAEFLANVFRDPVGEAGLLFINLADVALGALERVARAIDKIFGGGLGDIVASWRQGMQGYAEKLESGDRYTIERMQALDYNDLIAKGYSRGSALGAGLSDYALRNAEAQDIKAIANNTGAIKDTLQEEDLTALIDMAERQFVSQVNLTAQTPVITVNGANTGNTEQDRAALARAIAQILSEQVASMPTMPSPAFYGGRG